MTTITAPGPHVSGRFTQLVLAGSGGMGSVYRAVDQHTGQTVALKILARYDTPEDVERFTHEAKLLAELRHPGIVDYVAHGLGPDGTPYLAMEWLDGEDLAQRLARAKLTLAQSVLLMQLVAKALNVAHQRGVVHRDLKPANIFLRGGQIEGATLLDFGIARRSLREARAARTQTGRIVGTPEYMAPEQARGAAVILPSADIFSLGCVLFECLTGQPPFLGEHVVAVLTKILFADPPPLRQLQPELPEALEALVSRMLAKEPSIRPPDAAALLTLLDALTAHTDFGLPELTRRIVIPLLTVGDSEQQLLTVMLAGERSEIGDAITLAPNESQRLFDRLQAMRTALSGYGAQIECLANGSLVATLLPDSRRVATDQAALAARMALALREHWPGAVIALSTGRGVLRERLPIGEVIDRAAHLLGIQTAPAAGPADDDSVLIDELTAGLLDRRFAITPAGVGIYKLGSERAGTDELRLVLGRATPCVGREAELTALWGSLAGCIDESMPRALLVSAAPGAGKSRLRHEFLHRIKSEYNNVLILLGCGEPMSAGSAYAMLGQAIRQLCGIHSSQPPELQRAALRARVSAHLPAAEVTRVAELLGELCNTPFPDDDSVKLRAARQDPRVMAEQVRLAFLDFLRAECTVQPVLIVLEDLHWGDALTTQLVGSALEELTESPLLVFALARPEVTELFPNLWPRHLQTIRLSGLGRRACERLVQQVLGKQLAPEVTGRLIEQAAGNALYLEELIRAFGEGKGGEVPGTVLAMLQARIGRLEPGARRVLRAGSVLGDSFSVAGVQALVAADRAEVDGWCTRLVAAEVLEPRRERDPAGLMQYRFRHALMRDAAYSLLNEEDRRLSHHLAAQYLESGGERDAQVLAEHFLRSADSARAIHYVALAARQACDAYDAEGTFRFTERAVALGAQGEVLGKLRALAALVYVWQLKSPLAAASAAEAVALTTPGSAAWYQGMTVVFMTSTLEARALIWERFFPRLLATEPDEKALGICGFTLGAALGLACQRGLLADAQKLQQRIARLAADKKAYGPLSEGWLLIGEYDYLRHTEFDPWAQLALMQAADEVLQRAGSARDILVSQAYVGQAQAELGEVHQGELTLRRNLAEAVRSNHLFGALHTKVHLAALLAQTAEPDKWRDCAELTRELLASPELSSGFSGWAHCLQAQLALYAGDPAPAAEHCRSGLPQLSAAPFRRLWGQSILMQALSRSGQTAEALSLAADLTATLPILGGGGYVELPVRLALTETLQESGQPEAARAALRPALQRLHQIAKRIPNPAQRTRYLTQLPQNVRLLTLEATLLTPPANKIPD